MVLKELKLKVYGQLELVVLRGRQHIGSPQQWQAVHAEPALPVVLDGFEALRCEDHPTGIGELHQLNRLVGHVAPGVLLEDVSWFRKRCLVNP